jgi:hypothetical protein
MKTGNNGGSRRCPKWELAWASPTKPITVASCRKGTLRGAPSEWVRVVVIAASYGAAICLIIAKQSKFIE